MQELMSEIQKLKGSNESLETSVKEFELVNDYLHSQLHSRQCECLKGGNATFIVKYITRAT